LRERSTLRHHARENAIHALVCIADTHELHRGLVIPPGDILIHAGDFTFFSRRPWMYGFFDQWLGRLSHRHKIIIPGNHEFLLEDDEQRSAINNATLLVDSGVMVEGLKIWGSPVTPLYGGAFGLSRPADRKRHWARIPVNTDILITHGPPFGILDAAQGSNRHEGCPELLEAVLEAKPRLHVFGHLHAGYGTLGTPETIFVNATMFDEGGTMERDPIVIDLSVR
jgi:3',5'-cyclic AMP phosphodiesterase CpdA